MRVVIQRVSRAEVRTVDGVSGRIGKGLLIFLGIEVGDEEADADWLIGKVTQMRLFQDEEGKMNLNPADAGGEFLIVSQFTLHASAAKGNRPSFIRSARPEQAIPLYGYFIQRITTETGKPPQTGVFGAMMEVDLVNDGPVTILLDSKIRE